MEDSPKPPSSAVATIPGAAESPTPPSAPPTPQSAPPPALPGPRLLAAILVAAVLAAGTVTLDRPGLGWLLAGVALVVVGAAASVQFRVRPSRHRYLWAVAGVALLAVGTIRAAGWLYVFCVPMAGVCAMQALVGGASVRAMVAGVLAWSTAVVRALPWATRGVRGLAPRGRPQTVARLFVSAVVSVLLLVVFGALFASADAAFARLLDGAVPKLDLSDAPRWLFLFFAVGLTGHGIAYLVAAPRSVSEPGEPHRPLRLIEWALPVVLLDALFGVFVLVQLAVLFGGRDHVLRPGGPDFAQYARAGFWQLLVVTSLTLVVIGAVARFAPRAGRTERAAIRVLVGVLALLTLVIVVSAMKRMALYEETYGYTRLRISVSATELWLGLLFVLVLIAGVRLRTTWLPRAVLVSAVLGLLAFAAADPDRFIAGQNVDRFHRTGLLDVSYLSGLSPDAAPELARLPVEQRTTVLERINADVNDQRDSWYTYNFGRARACAAIK